MSEKKPGFWREMVVGTAIGAGMVGGAEGQPPALKEPPAKVQTVEQAPPPRRVVEAAAPADKEAEKKAVLHCMDILRNCQLENGAIDLRSQWNPGDKEQMEYSKAEYDENKAEWDKRQAGIKRGEGEKAPAYPAYDPKKKDSIRVVSYFSNFAAMAMLSGYEHHTKDQADLEYVSKWLSFYNRAQDPKIGIVPDHHGSRTNPEKKIHPTDQIDSVDAYASTHLQLLERYARLTDECSPANKLKCEKIVASADNLKAARLSLKAIEACLKEDGLTIARNGIEEKVKEGDQVVTKEVLKEYPVKFLMDNIEVYAGLRAGERYFKQAGATKEADRCKEIYTKMGEELKKYWQKDEKHFAWAIQGDGVADRTFDTGLDEPYPHGMANQYGLAWVANDAKEHKELWAKMQKDFKLDPADHKVFDEAMPIARSYMISLALKDGNEARWRATLLKQMDEMPAHRNAHIVAIAALTAMEQGKWMESILDSPKQAEKKSAER
jgi:hypothetical protein